MPLLPWGAGGRGSSEGEGVREGGSSMVVGPSGGGRAGVPSTGASAEIRGPSDEGGNVSPAAEGPWGPFDTGQGFSDASPSDEFGVAGVPPSRRPEGTEASIATQRVLAPLCWARALGAPHPHLPQARQSPFPPLLKHLPPSSSLPSLDLPVPTPSSPPLPQSDPNFPRPEG